MYSAIIVDDEQDQRDHLSALVEKKFPHIQLAAVCISVDEGVEAIKNIKPQLVFLDVVMPPKTGFDLLQRFETIDFEIIFTTSYEQYALQAFKVSAVDYLLKPFGADDLQQAVLKFEERIAQKNSLLHIQTLLHNINDNTPATKKIALPTLHGYIFVSVADIIRCEADNMYTTFYFADKSKVVVSKPIKDFEELLGVYNFFRVHTSHLINMQHLREYIKGDGGMVRMADGSTVDVSRRKKEDFLRAVRK